MPCDSPFYVDNPRRYVPGEPEKIPVPCGRCPQCKLRRVQSWIFRLQQEEKISSSSYFVTLTYSTDTVPITRNGFMTLDKTDVQKFFKRLRKLQPDVKLRYYAVGEYGENNSRPHYHILLFNLVSTEYIEQAWTVNNENFGYVHIGAVSSASIAYTCKYIDKGSKIPIHVRDDRLREFSLMSKGLGKNYLSAAVVDYHKMALDRNYCTQPSGEKIAMPRYYREKIWTDNEKRQQRKLIDVAVKQSLSELEIQVEQLYPGMDFDHYLDLQKAGRYKKFHKNLKDRKL